ncbi:kinase-like domain-containing protein [Scenedesmus sp. NREL 46B-D3]|nr:kinase-like domain-containing protein [Scenedesmus sp. NREL 46B-D3]
MDEQGKFEFIKELGRGSFGAVVLARNTKTGEQVAIKKMERLHLQRYVESEILNHSQLRHPHVVQFREVFLSTNHINIVMDYASGGSLFGYVQSRNRLREPLARWFFQQLILAVDYCHRKGVANRDIKLENTLLQVISGLPRPLVKICDFGYSKHDNRSVARSKVGTLTYMAPEVLQSKVYDGKTADIWSCGVVLYTMLVGRYPFQSNGVGLGQEVMEMLKKMKAQDEKRVKMAGIMADPWFRTDLPPDALNMNDKYLANTRPCPQSEADIKNIVAMATNDNSHDMYAGQGMDQGF